MATTITIGTLSTDTLAAYATWAAANANQFAAGVNSFISALVEDRELDFQDLGDYSDLDYLQWDYEAELDQLTDLRPDEASSNTVGVSSAIAQIGGVSAPTEPTLTIPVAAIPSLDAERPAISLPTLPGTDVGEAPSDAPQVTEFSIPAMDAYVLPSAPSFEDMHVPTAPTYVLPTFAASLPANALTAPTDRYAFVDTAYTSDLRDPLVAKLLYDLENGGYGIDTADETALWGRMRDRAEQAGRTATADAYRRAAQTSAPMPSGALFASLEKARAEVIRQMSEANRDIALKRADLYVENRKFNITQVQAYEKLDRDLHNAIQERAMNAAKATVELGIAVYDASVRNYNAQLEAYRAEAQVFEVRMRAELGKAELFKSQIDAERARGEFNTQKVNLYNAQLNAIKTVADIFKSKVEAISTLSQVQAQKVEIFRTRVQAYAMKVQAKSAEYEMYSSAVRGEMAKTEIYKADISAYEAKIRGEDVRNQVLAKNNDALIDRYKTQLAAYQAQLESKYKVLAATLDADKTGVAVSQVNIDSFKALTDAVLAGVNVRKDAQKMNNEWNQNVMRSKVDALKLRLEQLKATIANRTGIDQFGAKFYGDAMTATLTSLAGLTVKSA